MGLFSSKTITDVFANSFQMAESNPNELRDAVLYAIISNSSIAYNLLNLSLNGMANKSDQMRAYAKDHYTLGLPQCSYSDAIVLDELDVAAAISEDVTAPYGVLVNSHCVDFVSMLYVAAPFLISARLWDPASNIIYEYPSGVVLPPAPVGTTGNPIYVVKVQDVVLSSTEGLAEITYSVNAYRSRIVTTGNWEDRVSTVVTESYYSSTYQETCPIPTGISLGKLYCMAAYYLLDSGGTPGTQQHWWFYDIETNKHLNLTINDSIEESNNLMPIVPIRYNNQDLTAPGVQDTELYITSKKLMNKVGINIDNVATSLNENPDIAEIDHAYIMFGINLQTTDNVCIHYLVEFFDHLAEQSSMSIYDSVSSRLSNFGSSLQNIFSVRSTSLPSPIPLTATDEWLNTDDSIITATVVRNGAAASLQEHGLNLSLNYQHIQSDIVIGSIGEVGTAAKSWEKITTPVYTKTLGGRDGDKVLTHTTYVDDSELTLKLQVTENAYKRIIVKGLTHRNTIYGAYAVTTTLADVIDSAEEYNFIIPIHYGVASRLNIYQRNALYTESVHLVMNSVVHTTVKWYQSGIFKMIMMVVAVIITIYTGQAWLINLAAAANLGTLAVLAFLLKTILISIAVQVAFDYVAKVIGPEFAAILGVVVALVAIGFKPGGTINIGIKTLPTADALLMSSQALMSGAQKEIGNQLEDITQDMTDFTADSEAKTKKLEAAQELLTVPELLSFDLLEAQSQRFIQTDTDSPTQFYDLTIHTGNIGVLVLDVIPSYFDISLTLPKAGKMALEW